ncbi:MAG: NADPH:quinone oxidoreductase family protein [Burkholderiaceae bacterium]
MRAVVCRERGNDDAVAVEDWPAPPLIDDGVRIAVVSAGVSFANLLVLAGKHQNRPALPLIPGTEVSGIVVECGPRVTRFRPGERVAASVRSGGFAEQVVAPQSTVWPLPEAIAHDLAVQFPTIYATAHCALAWRARLAPGEWVLVHGAAGGSGLAAVEIAKCLGAKVIATAGSEEKLAAARRHGADVGVNYRTRAFKDEVLAVTGGRGADVIFDPVGGEVFDQSLRCIAPEGRIIPMGFASGTIPSIPANIVLVKNIDVIGLYWGHYLGWGRQPPAPGNEQRVRDAMAEMFGWCEAGRLAPECYRTFSLDEWRQALAAVSAREVIGKVALRPA